ncbi:hypothetical protein HH308_05090 [Gordonia sp. TBRC 11910]|uniref:Uncharacterized protein n=1 Tax=Gordonia asplenii TaxID=2725283 RepID=A0A848KR97_9ACTN|nr:hypothetical protein [Gordonia asplenii]NMO00589.1 hypothetical protein [Gordonia asplenii]
MVNSFRRLSRSEALAEVRVETTVTQQISRDRSCRVTLVVIIYQPRTQQVHPTVALMLRSRSAISCRNPLFHLGFDTPVANAPHGSTIG